MELFNFFKKTPQNPQKSSNTISKDILEKQIKFFDTLSQMFLESPSLRSTGGGRTEKMVSIMAAYKCIFVYFYEVEFRYGSHTQFLSIQELSKYLLTKMGLDDDLSRENILINLPSNWQDCLVVLNSLNHEESFQNSYIKNEIDLITNSMNKFSKN